MSRRIEDDITYYNMTVVREYIDAGFTIIPLQPPNVRYIWRSFFINFKVGKGEPAITLGRMIFRHGALSHIKWYSPAHSKSAHETHKEYAKRLKQIYAGENPPRPQVKTLQTIVIPAS